MKRIVLKQFRKQGNNYIVSLGNGTVHSFTSQRKAQDYLSKTNKFLTVQLFEAHTVYMDLWQEYQRCWFYFGYGTDKGKYTLHFQDQQKCNYMNETLSK